MASGTASPNYHGQLTANVVDTVTMDQEHESIRVLNIDGASRIDYTVDGSTPVVGGSPTGYVLPAVPWSDVPQVDVSSPVVVKLISAGTPHYSIIGAVGV